MLSIKLDTDKFFSWFKKYAKFQDGRKRRIYRALINSAELVVRRAQSYYLTGAALKVQTGRLRSSVGRLPTGNRPYEDRGAYWVLVGTNVWYGKFWELGYKGTVSVKRHTRKISQAFGHPISDGSKIITVRKHQRRLDIKPRKWLEPSIEDNISKIESLLTKAGVVFE